MSLLLAGAVHDRGLFLLDDDLLGAAEHGERHVLELDAEILGDQLTAGEDGDVLEHGLAAVAEARALTAATFKPATQLVDHQGRERFAFHVLGDDHQRLAGLHDRLQQRQHRLQARELLLVQQDIGVLEFGHHLLGIGDEIGRDIAAVELHALDDLDLGVERLGFLDGDDALVADLLHGLGDHLADRGVAVGRDGADLGHLGRGLYFLCAFHDVLHDLVDREIDAALQVHRIHAGGDRFGALLHDRMREQRRRGGAVAGLLVGLGGDLAHHLRAHVLELVLEFDFLRHRHPVLGDARRAIALVEHDVAALGAERHPHRVVEDVDAAQHLVARVGAKSYFFRSHFTLLRFSLISLSSS